MKNPSFSFSINLGLLFSALVTVFSGLLIQIHYHIGNHASINIYHAVLGFNHSQWSFAHKVSILAFSLVMAFHLVLHANWYRIVVGKRLITKNKQVLILSIVFVLAVISGYIPWLLTFANSEEATHKLFVEVHDKIGLILTVCLILHVLKRLKWFKSTFNKIRNSRNTQHAM